MTLDKAIEILQDILTEATYYPLYDREDAYKLGIEALKQLKHHRETYQKSSYVFLAGETEK